jgi:hypothetical protein
MVADPGSVRVAPGRSPQDGVEDFGENAQQKPSGRPDAPNSAPFVPAVQDSSFVLKYRIFASKPFQNPHRLTLSLISAMLPG